MVYGHLATKQLGDNFRSTGRHNLST